MDPNNTHSRVNSSQILFIQNKNQLNALFEKKLYKKIIVYEINTYNIS